MTFDSKSKPLTAEPKFSSATEAESARKANNGGASADSKESKEVPWNYLTSPTVITSSKNQGKQDSFVVGATEGAELVQATEELDSDSDMPEAPALVSVESIGLNLERKAKGTIKNEADKEKPKKVADTTVGGDFEMSYSSRESDTTPPATPMRSPPASPNRDGEKSSSSVSEPLAYKMKCVSSIENLRQRLDLANQNLVLNQTSGEVEESSTTNLSLTAMKRVSSLDCVKSAMRSETIEFAEVDAASVVEGIKEGESKSAGEEEGGAEKEKESSSWDNLLLCVPLNTFQALRDCRKPRFSPSRQGIDGELEFDWMKLIGWGTVIVAMIIMMLDRNNSSKGHTFNSTNADALEGFNQPKM